MGVFEVSDIFEVAIRIEENGVDFYRHVAQITTDEEAKKTFNYLAGEEDRHKTLFKEMLSKIEKHEAPESYPGEYGAYLRDYVDNNVVFTRQAMDLELSRIKNTLSAINFAIRNELDSILYYHEIKRFVSGSQHVSIDRIIDEERKHFETLSGIMKTYVKGGV